MLLDKEFLKRLVKIALPISLQGLISSSLTLLDNLMVNQLGEMQLAAVGLATQSFHLEWLVIFGFCSGCATFYTQFWGVKDIRNIRKVIGIAELTCFCIGLCFFVAGYFFPTKVLGLFTKDAVTLVLGAEYLKTAAINFILVSLTQPLMYALRATEQTRIPFYISIGSFLTDVVFNYLLIFGNFGFPRLGVKGAAIATVFARVLELGLALTVIFVKKNILAGPIKEYFSFTKDFAKRVYINASTTTINETLWCLAMTAQNAAYGHMGTSAFAAVQATATIMDLFQLAGFSLGDASIIFVGECLGRNEVDEAKVVSKKLIKASLTVGCSFAVIILLVRGPILGLFNLSRLGFSYARKLLVIRAIYMPINLLVALLVSGILRAGGDTRFAAITEIFCMWGWCVPAAFLGLKLGIPVYWTLVLALFEEIIKLSILAKRYFSGKWLKNMIKGM